MFAKRKVVLSWSYRNETLVWNRWRDIIPKTVIPSFNPCFPNTLFHNPLKTSENRKVFWCFQGVEKGCIGNKWVKYTYFLVSPKTLKNLLKKQAASFQYNKASKSAETKSLNKLTNSLTTKPESRSIKILDKNSM